MGSGSVDVNGFFARSDISADAKKRVKEAGDTKAANPAEAWRAMQVQILFEQACRTAWSKPTNGVRKSGARHLERQSRTNDLL